MTAEVCPQKAQIFIAEVQGRFLLIVADAYTHHRIF